MELYGDIKWTNSLNNDFLSTQDYSKIPSESPNFYDSRCITITIIDDKKNASKSIENIINENRRTQLERDLTDKFISCILEDDFEYGVEYKAHILVKEQMNINAAATKEWLSKIYGDYFNRSNILIGILRVISRFPREEISYTGETIAIASLAHNDTVVQENAIRVFECWGGQRSIYILESIDDNILRKLASSASWIKEYLDGVIEDLKIDYAN